MAGYSRVRRAASGSASRLYTSPDAWEKFADYGRLAVGCTGLIGAGEA
jgi:hypothetical protein